MDDIQEISFLVEKVYVGMNPWQLDIIKSQIQHFPAGQFVALFENKIIGYSSSIIISGKLALNLHTMG